MIYDKTGFIDAVQSCLVQNIRLIRGIMSNHLVKKLLFGLFAVIGMAALMSVSGVSAAAEKKAGQTGPYEGVFHGIVTAPDGSKAPMSLDLTHRNNIVEGTVFLGDGLTIDAGMCGAGSIPASSITAAGKTSVTNPKKLSATSAFDVSGITVNVLLDSQMQGDTLNAKAKIDLPWLCGSDPVITGTLQRA